MENLKEVNSRIQEAIKKEGLSVRMGMKFVGKVVSLKTRKTAVIEIKGTKYLSKYSRYAKVRSKIHVHVPEGIELKEGDVIVALPTRKISKTKASVVYEVIERD